MKGEERDADGQRDFWRGNRRRAGEMTQRIHRIDDQVRILENREDADVDEDRHGHSQLAASGNFAASDPQTESVIHHR